MQCSEAAHRTWWSRSEFVQLDNSMAFAEIDRELKQLRRQYPKQFLERLLFPISMVACGKQGLNRLNTTCAGFLVVDRLRWKSST